jgi:hypothetical protein
VSSPNPAAGYEQGSATASAPASASAPGVAAASWADAAVEHTETTAGSSRGGVRGQYMGVCNRHQCVH